MFEFIRHLLYNNCEKICFICLSQFLLYGISSLVGHFVLSPREMEKMDREIKEK